MRMRLDVLLPATALLALPACGEVRQDDGPVRGVARLEERRIPFPDSPSAPAEPRVDRAYFDADQLRWDGSPVAERPAQACPAPAEARALPVRRAHLALPRVDERRCPDPQRRQGLRKSLLGFDAQGRPSWERPLALRSGDAELEQWLIGATPEALVLSSLEVWSPSTGATVVPAPTHQAGGRAVPDHSFSTSALYLPSSREVLAFEADVTLLRREGGLYRIALDTGRKELWLPVSATLLGTYDRVEAMAASRDGRLALLGLRQEVRGPTSVGVAVYDLATRERIFEERLGAGHACSEPQIVAGPDGHFAFAYRDDNAREHVLVRYRVRP